jgi:uncharacterized FlaG/YvyC family protein
MNINSSIPTLDPGPVHQVPGVKPVSVQTRVQHEATDNAAHKHVKGEKLAEIQTILSNHDISMKFSTNDQTNQVVVRLVDDKTGEIIRQLPNDVSLKLAAANIKLQGWMVDETA